MSNRIKRWHRFRSQQSIFSRFVLSFTINRLYQIRNDFATRYIAGKGYEIGAQKSPLTCKKAQKITYIDYLSREDSSQKYHLSPAECVSVDIVADANNLTDLPANSTSFIIANHVLEHSPNPIAALLGWLRILQNGGRLFLTLPNCRSNEFDFEKTPASLAHFKKDFERATAGEDIASEHIFEHIRLIDEIDPSAGKNFTDRYKEIVTSDLHTHYHVFNKENTAALLNFIHQQTPIMLKNSFTLDNGFELLFIIEKIRADSHTTMTVKHDHLFNFVILLKQGIAFLVNRIFSNRLSHE